ncbi:NAD(P)/FAD-dependent oxidoreductase [Brenneria goodwinii]|uniref:Sarcosine oxidase beta subunit n=1 Tax=Brenneria goodwinii TaxID=1109412 RepID=A0A0G4JY54_9GAMM|nr:FAD-binding oxidoreductase [Brenneria goodwinii]CPR18640.1 Sarcosine oxidase beta subunit [Brenneria goodwinii]
MTNRLQADVLIVGGGLVGSSAALALSRQNLDVILVERDTCGSRSSGINFGGVRRQGRAPAQLPLALRAKKIWDHLEETIGIKGEYIRTGHLKLARTAQDFAALEEYRDKTRDYGLELELLSAQALRRRCPWLSPALAGGSFCPGDGQANPRLVAPAFAAAAKRAGARIFERQEMTRVDHQGDEFTIETRDGLRFSAPNLLNCAGAWSLTIAEQFGDAVPLTHGYPAMAVTEPLPYFINYGIGVQGGDIYCRQVARGNVVMGGGRGIGLGSALARSTQDNLIHLMEKIIRLIPALEHAQIIRTWSGVEGYLPDRQPVICASPTTPGLFHGFGFSGGGFETGPAAGEVLADLVINNTTETPIDAFDIRRFSSTKTAA